ncbi:MAG: HVA1 family protein, partial [Pseudomonadota bacterium]
MNLSTGDSVSWAWGDGTATGTIKQIYTDKVTKTI